MSEESRQPKIFSGKRKFHTWGSKNHKLRERKGGKDEELSPRNMRLSIPGFRCWGGPEGLGLRIGAAVPWGSVGLGCGLGCRLSAPISSAPRLERAVFQVRHLSPQHEGLQLSQRPQEAAWNSTHAKKIRVLNYETFSEISSELFGFSFVRRLHHSRPIW